MKVLYGVPLLLLRHCRSKWTLPWAGFLSKENATEENALEVQGTDQSQEEQLYAIACTVGKTAGESWKCASLGNAALKGKILCEYESTFSLSIPDTDLGTITTFGDLLEILENYQSPEEAPNVYPLFRDVTLPPNLNVQFINTAPIPRKTRKSFENVGVIRQMERGKKKRNFVTRKAEPAEKGRRQKIKESLV